MSETGYVSPRYQRMVAETARRIEEQQRRKREEAERELEERRRAAEAADPGGLPSISKQSHMTDYQRQQYRRFKARPQRGDKKV